jgi:hypothetical protein
MASHTPIRPSPKNFPNKKLNPIRNVHIENIEIHIAAFASPDALNVTGKPNERGQNNVEHMKCKYKICLVIVAVASDK